MYLTEEELGKFANMTYDTPNRNFTRDMFLFSCWTGICYCDMRALTEKNLVKAEDGSLWIHTERQKTGTRTEACGFIPNGRRPERPNV